jgi:protein-tyrosine phosphatase
MKSLLLASVLLVPVPLFAALEQKSPPARSPDAPLLVWDLDPTITAGFRNFRTSNDPLKPKADGSLPSAAGLTSLHESGSSEFSPAGLKAMLAKFSGPVTVFDLRQEDHGFINDTPVSWFATNNWANVGKGHAEVVAEEQARLAGLPPGAPVTIADDKAKKGEGAAASGPATPVVSAETERELVTAAGANYVRITVSDHCRPTDEEVDRFITAVRQLPPDAWAHFHCRAGRGRTTTFMALYDMLRNAGQVSLQDIDQRQSLLAGDYDLLSKEGEPNARAAEAADRAAFVRAFYDYAKANPNGEPRLWTEWLKSQP